MSSVDPARLVKTLNLLLRHQPEGEGICPDPEGWVALADLAAAASRMLGEAVTPADLEWLSAMREGRRLEVSGGRARQWRKPRDGTSFPDILYHATTKERAKRVLTSGALTLGRNRQVFLSASEADAWRAAHRMKGSEPHVLFVDANHARRRGVRFSRNRRNGLFVARSIPVAFILNLQREFAEQLSAGGIPMCRDPDGTIRLALIRVTRKSGATWEVAKGKLEHGEVPEETAIREVREEMGVRCGLRITKRLGEIRYGFVAPGGLHRLKTVYLFLMEPDVPVESFAPMEKEGIREVRWFTPEEACSAVTHPSLVPLMRRAREIILEEKEDGSRPER